MMSRRHHHGDAGAVGFCATR